MYFIWCLFVSNAVSHEQSVLSVAPAVQNIICNFYTQRVSTINVFRAVQSKANILDDILKDIQCEIAVTVHDSFTMVNESDHLIRASIMIVDSGDGFR